LNADYKKELKKPNKINRQARIHIAIPPEALGKPKAHRKAIIPPIIFRVAQIITGFYSIRWKSGR
jgi:hypothetical protein